MQRQDSSQATSTMGNTPNLNIGSYDGNTKLVRKSRKPYTGKQGKRGEDFPYVWDLP